MATTSDVRAWAISEGMEVNERGRLPREIKDAFILAHPDEEIGATESGDLDSFDPISDVPTPEKTTPGEVAPKVGRPRKRGFSLRGKPGVKGKPKRTRLDRLGEHLFALGSKFVESKSIALSRILAMQSPVAGIVLEENIKHGGIVDRVLQPLARTEDRVSAIYAMFAPMAIVVAIEKNPELFPTLEGPLKLALVEWAAIAGPAMEKAAARERKLAEQFEEYDIDSMVRTIFSHMIAEDSPEVVPANG